MATSTIKNEAIIGSYKISNGSPVKIPTLSNASQYFACIVMGLFQGIGTLILAITVNNNSLVIKNMITGADFSNPVLSFSVSNGVLTISTTSQNSNITVIRS